MVVCVPVTSDGQVAGSWGRARRVAVAVVSDGGIVHWQEDEVAWDDLHDTGPEGAHHARVARYLIAHHVEVVLATHVGPGMVRMLAKMGIDTRLGVGGDARAAVLDAAQR